MSKTLYAEFTVKPGSEARVAEMMLELTEHVSQEPGNVLFLPYTREENPRDYFVFEVYRDEAAFQDHIRGGLRLEIQRRTRPPHRGRGIRADLAAARGIAFRGGQRNRA